MIVEKILRLEYQLRCATNNNNNNNICNQKLPDLEEKRGEEAKQKVHFYFLVANIVLKHQTSKIFIQFD